jgi:hypothetical protein
MTGTDRKNAEVMIRRLLEPRSMHHDSAATRLAAVAQYEQAVALNRIADALWNKVDTNPEV